jgi:NDP-sugar pyrophosphorylase family protein
MRAVILAGGLGTRLRPYTTVIPKPLVPVGDRPVLEHIMRSLYADGVRKVDLCVSHLGELIRLYLSQLALAKHMDLAFHWEEEPLGTAGALRVVPELDGTFIAMNGDILTTLSYRSLVEFHLEREAALTIAMRSARVDIDLGVIETRDQFVTGYREKPSLQYDVSMGIYVYDARALAHLPAGQCQFPELVLRLVDAGERVAAFRADDVDWFDIGTIEEHERAAQEFERAPLKFGA